MVTRGCFGSAVEVSMSDNGNDWSSNNRPTTPKNHYSALGNYYVSSHTDHIYFRSVCVDFYAETWKGWAWSWDAWNYISVACRYGRQRSSGSWTWWYSWNTGWDFKSTDARNFTLEGFSISGNCRVWCRGTSESGAYGISAYQLNHWKCDNVWDIIDDSYAFCAAQMHTREVLMIRLLFVIRTFIRIS